MKEYNVRFKYIGRLNVPKWVYKFFQRNITKGWKLVRSVGVKIT